MSEPVEEANEGPHRVDPAMTTAFVLENELASFPPMLPRYVVEAFLIDTVRALRDLIERIDG